jgi:hypothetical protein
MDWSNAYTAIRERHAGPTSFWALSGKHQAGVIGNLIIGRAAKIRNIWNKYNNFQQEPPLDKRKVSVGSLASGVEWKPLDDVVENASGRFYANFDKAKCVDETVEFVFSGDAPGSAPVIALIASAAANALAPEKSNEAEEIKIEARIGANATEVKIHIDADSDLVVRMGACLGKLTTALGGLEASEAIIALQSDEGSRVLTSLRSSGPKFEQAITEFQAYIKELAEKQAKVPELEVAPKRGKVDASFDYDKLHLKGDYLIFEFECNEASQPIVEHIVMAATSQVLDHSGGVPVKFKEDHACMRWYCDGVSKADAKALGRRIGACIEALNGVDSAVAMRALRSDQGTKEVLENITDEGKFQAALAAWKSAVDQGKFAESE